MNQDLFRRSIEIIKSHQNATGAYLASPSFTPYRYSWFRDGAFIAYAMDLAGERESAEAFHQWCRRLVIRYRDKLSNCIADPNIRMIDNGRMCFHCRFTVDGDEIIDGWSVHQLDGLGTWLWTLIEHLKHHAARNTSVAWVDPLTLVRDYLSAMWRYPCADCWEENDDQIHTYTLASIYAGLKSLADYCDDSQAEDAARAVQSYILHTASTNGMFVKSIGSDVVDANLLGLIAPFAVIDPEDPRVRATVHRIKEKLYSEQGGLRRYAADSYYGGGGWLPLTAWLGWVEWLQGDKQSASRRLAWIETKAASNGDLPEQVVSPRTNVEQYREWLERWGPPASPLLWSHAMYIILYQALQDGQ